MPVTPRPEAVSGEPVLEVEDLSVLLGHLPVLRGITGAATNTYTPALGTSFVVVQADGGVTGSFASLTQPTSGCPGRSVSSSRPTTPSTTCRTWRRCGAVWPVWPG